MGISELAKSVCCVERNLKYLAEMPRVSMSNIRDFYGASQRKKRVGRGGKRGKTSCRGHKGQGQRTGKPRVGFAGGQTPFYRAVPKHNITTHTFQMARISLNKIQLFIDSQRIDPTMPITLEVLKHSGLWRGSPRDGVRLLGSGHTWFQGSIDIEVTRASQDAITAIERNGGSVRCVYHDPVSLQHRVKLKKSKQFSVEPPPVVRPSEKLMMYYANPDKRGYLADPVEVEKRRLENLKLGKIVDQLKNFQITDD